MAWGNTKESIKIGIWLYLFLLLFEGALRKWFLPTLTGPLALIRDPLALWLLYAAYKNGLLKANIFLRSMVFVSILAIGTTFILGHGNLAVCLYGARITLLHFPLIFVIGKVFDREDVLKMGNVLLYIAMPMTLLMIVQFYSPQSAWVNRGLGGDLEGAGFSGALGYFRPPGTFSFITGLTQFYGVLSCFILYFWLKPGLVNRMVLITATICLLAAIPFSISRTLFYQTLLIVLFAVFAVARKSKYVPKLIFGAMASVVLLWAFLNTSYLETPIEAFTARFEGATRYEGGVSGTLIDRYLGGMVNAISNSSEVPFFGHGLGMGTNAGGQLITGEKVMLIYAEDEWARLVGESGLLLGLAFIAIRLGLSVYLAVNSFRALAFGNLLPWLLLGFCLLTLPNGQWGQPTTLGFSTLIAGMTIAAFNLKHEA